MEKSNKTRGVFESILDKRNIYSAIYSLESYVFDKGLLDTDHEVILTDEQGNKTASVANDLVLFVQLTDKFQVDLMDKVISTCRCRLQSILEKPKELFEISVYFKLKKWDEEKLVCRPIHTARLIDMICMVSILNYLMFEDDYEQGVRSLSDLSKLLPHNFFGNVPSTHVRQLFMPWQAQYKEYSNQVITHCLQYQQSHAYQTEVSLDIRNFFPSIPPVFLFGFILEKLLIQDRGKSKSKGDWQSRQKQELQSAVAKLLFFHLDAERINPWKDDYYPNQVESDFFMNCGIPQGLPQSYFFGNLCMIHIKDLMMRKDFFQGDAYFYVDDSVIYLQSAWKENEFREKINGLNTLLAAGLRTSQNMDELIKDLKEVIDPQYVDFHKNLNYRIQFHTGDKSTLTHIDQVDTLYELLSDISRQTYGMNQLSNNRDEIDDEVSLDKLKALNEVVTGEMRQLKSRVKSPSHPDKEKTESRLKLLRRFKKFFLFRLRRLEIQGEGGVERQKLEEFKQRLKTERKAEAWFERNDEDIFQAESQLIIQSLPKEDAISFCSAFETWEKTFFQENGKKLAENAWESFYYTQSMKNACRLKSLSKHPYEALTVWTRENFAGMVNQSLRKQFTTFRHFLNADESQSLSMSHIWEKGFQNRDYTTFVVKASPDFQRRILNAFFSESMGVEASDALTFVKRNARKCHYAELRILAYLRNRLFEYRSFKQFVGNLQENDVSNTMGIDMGLLEVLDLFITRVKVPEWVDALICTHRITKGLWYNGSKFLNAYTLHNEEHAVTLIHKSLELTGRIDYFALKKVDYYILFLACYLHDISMVIHPDLGRLSSENHQNLALISDLMFEMNDAVQTFFQVSVENKRNARMKDAGTFLVKIFQYVFEYFEGCVRTTHNSDSARFILAHQNDLLSYLQPTILSFVASVSDSHGYEVESVYGLKSRAKDDTVSLKYLMILIRLADLLDVANDRVNYHLLRQNLKHLSPISKFHWISHLVTDKMELKTSYEVPNSTAEEGPGIPDARINQIQEHIHLNLYLNFKQLTTEKKKLDCPFRNCERKPDHFAVEIRSKNDWGYKCTNQNQCPILCHWMMKKHEWFIQELVALNDYLYSVNNSLFHTDIHFNIYFRNDMRLDADMFDEVQDFLRNS